MSIVNSNQINSYFYRCWTGPFKTIGNNVNYDIVKVEDTEYNSTHTDKTYYRLLVYFQGSVQREDWLYNFKFFATLRKRKPYKGMDVSYKVHSGFLECWKQVEDVMREAFADKSISSIVISGYSHGAALAVLCHECAWWCRPDLRDRLITLAFEAPRVYAGFTIKKSLRERWENCFIFRDKNDIVTHLPPVIFGFRTVGRLVKIGNHKTYGIGSFIKAHCPENVDTALKEYTQFYNYLTK